MANLTFLNDNKGEQPHLANVTAQVPWLPSQKQALPVHPGELGPSEGQSWDKP